MGWAPAQGIGASVPGFQSPDGRGHGFNPAQGEEGGVPVLPSANKFFGSAYFVPYMATF